MKQDLLPIFNPLSDDFLFLKTRKQIHHSGDWHKGIQANIIRKNNQGTFDILIQKRSNKVDISKNKFDQSLATQMTDIDNLDELKTLSRGLQEELGVRNFAYYNLNLKIRIIKKYEDQLKILNRELINLFVVLLKNNNIAINFNKINSLFWLEWGEFLKFYKENAAQFTKTAQFYFENRELIKKFKKASYKILSTKKNHTDYSSDYFIVHFNLGVNKKTYKLPRTESQRFSEILSLNRLRAQ